MKSLISSVSIILCLSIPLVALGQDKPAEKPAEKPAPFTVTPLDDSKPQSPSNCLNVNPGSHACLTFPAHPLPKSIDEFLALRKNLMESTDDRTKAYGGATLLIYALVTRTINMDLGDKFLVIALARHRLTKWTKDPWSRSKVNYKGYTWKRAESETVNTFTKNPYRARAYLKGAKPSDRYKIDLTQPLSVVYRKQNRKVPNPASGKYKLFVCTMGTPYCRPVSLERNNRGIWKVSQFSTIALPINTAPKKKFDDDI
jgi:hypothetical protein